MNSLQEYHRNIAYWETASKRRTAGFGMPKNENDLGHCCIATPYQSPYLWRNPGNSPLHRERKP